MAAISIINFEKKSTECFSDKEDNEWRFSTFFLHILKIIILSKNKICIPWGSSIWFSLFFGNIHASGLIVDKLKYLFHLNEL